VCYDDGNRLLLVMRAGSVVSYPADARKEYAPPTTLTIGEGPTLAARFSLDGAVLAVQRSATDVEFVAASSTSSAFWQRCRRASETILGFFWVASAGVDFVLATTGGLELYTLLPGGGGLRLVDEKRKAGITWMLYTHETRLALLGSGPQGNRLFGFQFSGSGHVRLPKFDLPVPAGVSGAPRPVVGVDSVRLLAIYGRLFCAHVDVEAQALVLYRFYRDALLRQHTYPLPSSAIAMSVIDNALVLHTLDSGVALVLDILSASTHPLASPLPLGGVMVREPPAGSQAQPFYGDDCAFLAPDLLLQRGAGTLGRLKLDLRALAASCSDRPVLVGFLQRRREPLQPALSQPGRLDARCRADGPKALTLSVVRTVLQEREPLADLSRVFDVLCAACSNAVSAAAKGRGMPPGSPAVAAEELTDEVFAPMAEEVGMDGFYLRAALLDFMRAADAVGIAVPASLSVLLVDLFVRDGCAHQLPAWAPVLLPPSGARTQPALAASLSAAAAACGLPSVAQLAADAQRRSLPHDAVVRGMLSAGQVLLALRYARRHRVENVPPAVFLDAAAQADMPTYASAYRFCADHVSGFSSLPDFERHASRLQTNAV